ncbi:enoyl-CoA hydratase/isomerase family protein [Aeromicrobium sp. Leaf350]|uniref:enoyl-CoA hydratase/isomerase family protein n=1 Tax=Aeromicrobium sp. Leaf350 TaxID=2876565 RepID=UPI001E2EFC17|nr:enoyl-CoA hydratase/isomerase family protein [Aeromicrobium sp. Leaf350]
MNLPNDSELVRLDRPQPGVVVLTLDRAENLNTLNVHLVRDLLATLDSLASDRDTRVVILTGSGRAFCAGLDLRGYGDPDRETIMGRPLAMLDRQREISSLISRIHSMPQPVIAAVNGAAAGAGLAMACASDVRVAAVDAVFAVSFIRAGYSGCDLGVSWLLPRLVGASRAHELMLTGRRFNAQEAERIGLVTDVVEDALQAALDKAAEILLNPPASVELTKQGMWLALETPALATTIELENRQQIFTATTRDQSEARAAFLEKRPPRYEHR